MKKLKLISLIATALVTGACAGETQPEAKRETTTSGTITIRNAVTAAGAP